VKKQSINTVFLITPFESKLTQRGTRHPILARIFVEKGYRVEYITSNFNHSNKSHFKKEYIRNISDKLTYNLKVFNVLGYRKNISIARIITHIQFSLKVYLCLIKIVKSGNIILIPSRPPELIWVCSILKEKSNVRLILDIRDILPDAFPIRKGMKKRMFEIYCNIFQKKSLCAFDRIIYTSTNFKNWFNRYSPNREVLFIPLGFDTDRWREMKTKNSDDFKDTFNIFYIGNLTPNIDLFPIIEAIKKNPKFQFTIIGGGNDLPKVQKYVQSQGVKNVRFTGIIDPSNVPQYLKDQHISVIPMHLNTLPNKLFDSIAAYLPILVIGENDTSEFVRENNVGWVLPFNEREIKEFFDKINEYKIIEKSNEIAKIRYKFSKESLYNEFVEYATK